MPVPKPHTDESKSDFMARCMHTVMHDGTTSDNDQGVAICMSQWRRATGEPDPRAASHFSTYAGGAVDNARIRHERLHGRDFIVIPTVALVADRSLRPLGSIGEEYIPAAVLQRAADSWNGRAVVYAHPLESASRRPITARTPVTAEKHLIGTVYNARFEDNRLRAELWIDSQLVDRVPGARAAIDRALAGSKLEVSVGAMIAAEPIEGGSGQSYRWVAAAGDHIAILEPGQLGACSIAMGCGAPRYLQETDMSEIPPGEPVPTPGEPAPTPDPQPTPVPVPQPTVVAAAGRRLTLWGHLRRIFKSMDELAKIIPEDGLDEEDDTDTTTVTAAEASKFIAAAASILGGKPASTATGETRQKGDTRMCQSNELAGRLIANASAPFREEQRESLVALGEESLRALCSQYDAPPQPATVTAKLTDFTEAEVLTAFPEIRAAVDAHKAAEAREKSDLVARIEPVCNGAYTAAALTAMPNEQLRSLAKALALDKPRTDYGLRGVPGENPQPTEQRRRAPDPYKLPDRSTTVQ